MRSSTMVAFTKVELFETLITAAGAEYYKTCHLAGRIRLTVSDSAINSYDRSRKFCDANHTYPDPNENGR
jgi:hypothetical protein